MDPVSSGHRDHVPAGLHDDIQVFGIYGDKNYMRDAERIKTRNL
jgi:hypothetical protein